MALSHQYINRWLVFLLIAILPCHVLSRASFCLLADGTNHVMTDTLLCGMTTSATISLDSEQAEDDHGSCVDIAIADNKATHDHRHLLPATPMVLLPGQQIPFRPDNTSLAANLTPPLSPQLLSLQTIVLLI